MPGPGRHSPTRHHRTEKATALCRRTTADRSVVCRLWRRCGVGRRRRAAAHDDARRAGGGGGGAGVQDGGDRRPVPVGRRDVRPHVVVVVGATRRRRRHRRE